MCIFLKYVKNVCGFLKNRSQFWVFIDTFVLSASKLIRNGYCYLRSTKSVKTSCPIQSLCGILRTDPEMLGLHEHFFSELSLVKAQRAEFKTSAGWFYTLILTALKFLHTYIQTYVHTCTHIYIHSCTHTYIHTFIHTIIHTYIIRTYKHT